MVDSELRPLASPIQQVTAHGQDQTPNLAGTCSPPQPVDSGVPDDDPAILPYISQSSYDQVMNEGKNK